MFQFQVDRSRRFQRGLERVNLHRLAQSPGLPQPRAVGGAREEAAQPHVAELPRQRAREAVARHVDADVRAIPRDRGLHSSTFRLNVSALCGIWGAFRGFFGDV
jgi:hypothetical protein